MHAMAAGFIGAQELNIDDDESKTLAAAVAGVAAHYNVTANPKTVAWVNLATALGMVYGPRVAAIRLRRAAGRKDTAAKKSSPIKADGPSVVAGRFPLVVGDAPVGGIPHFDLQSSMQ